MAKFGLFPQATFGLRNLSSSDTFSQVWRMDLPQESCCCFCQKPFKYLGNHYKGCPERHGADYQHLSEKTTAKKHNGKAKKAPCPKCGKCFLRLETHLRNSASCKVTQAPPSLVPHPLDVPVPPSSVPPCPVPHASDAPAPLSFVPPSLVPHPSDASVPPSFVSPRLVPHPSDAPVSPSSVSHPLDKQAAHDTILYPMTFVQNSHACHAHTPNAHTQPPAHPNHH